MTIYLVAMADDFDEDTLLLEGYGYFTSEDAANRKIEEISAKVEVDYQQYRTGMTERYEARKAEYNRLRDACLAANVPVPDEISEPLPPYLMSLRQWQKSYPRYIPVAIEPGE